MTLLVGDKFVVEWRGTFEGDTQRKLFLYSYILIYLFIFFFFFFAENNLCTSFVENIVIDIQVLLAASLKQFYENNIFVTITKTYLYNFDPLKAHFYTVKLGFIGVYIIFSYFCS